MLLGLVFVDRSGVTMPGVFADCVRSWGQQSDSSASFRAFRATHHPVMSHLRRGGLLNLPLSPAPP